MKNNNIVMLEKEIELKSIILVGINAGNRRTALGNTIRAIAPHYQIVRSVTTCQDTAQGKKSEYHAYVSVKEFRELIKEKKLMTLTFLSTDRGFGILHEEYDPTSLAPKILRLDYNGLKDFYTLYGPELLRKKFSIIALMPSISDRMETMRHHNVPVEKIESRINNTKGPEEWFFERDPRAHCINASYCIDAVVTNIQYDTDLVPLAQAIVDYVTSKTTELVIPKPFI